MTEPDPTHAVEDRAAAQTPRASRRGEPAAESDIVLTPQLSAHWALAPRHLLLIAMFCVLTMVVSYLPLRGTDIWGHVSYGNWILDHRQLPEVDPFASLTEGMKLIDSAWLSQVLFAFTERRGGAEALSAAFTLLTVGYFALICRACFLQSGRITVALAGVWIALLVGFSRLTTIRPENFGVFAFGLLLWLLVRHRVLSRHHSLLAIDSHAPPIWQLYVGVFITMWLWANTHGSFICGLATLGCLLVGELWDALVAARRQSAGAMAVAAAPNVRRAVWLLETATIATLLNPYGFDLLLNSIGFAKNAVLGDVLEWQALTLNGIGGREFALSWLLITIVLRHSKQRVVTGEALMLGLFAVLAATRLRMVGWYAAVSAVFLAPHLTDIWNRFASPLEGTPEVKQRDNPLELTMGRSWTYSLVAMLMVWIAFALSPLGRPVVGDEPRKPENLYDQSTPLGVTEYLREHPPQTRIFNPQWWGDWLVWDGPAGLQPFVTTNMHLIPKHVWDDYRNMNRVASGWNRALKRYRIDMLVLDKQQQDRLAKAVKSHEDWELAYEDRQAIIFQRRPASVTNASKEAADGGLNSDVPESSADSPEQ
ncbi:MAG: hypothetical protein KDB14_17220 [Planctomycetales bacterium]|nr:hypothetical protein [Planctomycetales bacterium]